MSRLVLTGDCRAVMATLADALVDAVVTDPPYELTNGKGGGGGFMGKAWDATGIAFDVPMWTEVLRVLKPGGHLLAFGGTRTSHRMVCAIEDAGFVVRDSLVWMYGSGFPKSLDVSKAIDKAAGAEREVVGTRKLTGTARCVGQAGGYAATAGRVEQAYAETELRETLELTAPATPLARQWDGWGTALKPAHEPICLARKPLVGTVAANVTEFGTGAINVDGCRVGTSKRVPASPRAGQDRIFGTYGPQDGTESGHDPNIGRWPPNVLLDDEAAAMLDEQSGERPSTLTGRADPLSSHVHPADPSRTRGSMFGNERARADVYADTGGASRFFPRFNYCAKASTAERECGLDDFPIHSGGECTDRQDDSAGLNSPRAGAGRRGGRRNTHPTVKPVELMRWLVRLITPPGGLVLDPFTGSGTTGMACALEGFRFVGIELDEHHADIARARIRYAGQRRGRRLLPDPVAADDPRQLGLFVDGGGCGVADS